MRFWLDTEFIEDGHTIDLISIGIVDEDGGEYYAVSSDCKRERANDWVKKNVLPQVDWSKAVPRAQIRTEILEFCGFASYDHKSGEKHQHEFWANYGAYDWVVLCQLFGNMDALPEGWPMYCHDLQQLLGTTGKPDLPKQEGGHHALEDARWLREAWNRCTHQDLSVIAKRASDPNAEVDIVDIEATPGTPERILLVNPIAQTAWEMRRAGQKRLTSRKRIMTSLIQSKHTLMKTPLLDYTTGTQVVEAMYLRAIRVSVGDGLSPEYMSRLWEAQFEFIVDGESLIKSQAIRPLLGVKEVALPVSGKTSLLFHANRKSVDAVSDSGAPIVSDDTKDWIGYMLSNGSRIQASLNKVPLGGGEVAIKVSCDLALYTTKP